MSVCLIATAFLIDRQLKHEVARKSCEVSLDLFIESFGRQAIASRQIAIETNVLMSGDQNRFRYRIHAHCS